MSLSSIAQFSLSPSPFCLAVFCRTGTTGGYWGILVGTVVRFSLATKDSFGSDKIVFFDRHDELQEARAACKVPSQIACEEFFVVKNLPEFFASGVKKGQPKMKGQWKIELSKKYVSRN